MDRAGEYLEKAAAAEDMARRSNNPDLKRSLHEIAGAWRVLAAHAERLSNYERSLAPREKPFIADDPSGPEGD